MTTNETLREYIGYLETVIGMQKEELAQVYEFCDDWIDDGQAETLGDICTRHDTYKLDEHFAEVIAEVAKMKDGAK